MPETAATGLRLAPDAINIELHGPPRIELELLRGQYPSDLCEIFQPMRLPERFRLTLGGRLARCFERARLRFTLQLQAGRYQLPLGGSSCELEVPAQAQALGWAEVGPSPDDQVPAILAFNLQFQPALTIDNVLQTLSGLHQLVEDPRLALMRPLLQLAPPWLRQFAGVAMLSADSAGTVLLEQVSARPHWHKQGQEESSLRFAFSGRVRWLDQVETRFDRVTLPATVLPFLYARLDRLFSPRPLATAELRSDHEGLLELADSLRRALVSTELDLDVQLATPQVLLHTATTDGTTLQARLPAGERCKIRGKVRARTDGDALEVEAEKLSLMPLEAEAGTGLQLDLRGRVQLDLSRGRTDLAERLGGSLELTVPPQSSWPSLEVDLSCRDRIAIGEVKLPLRVEELGVEGGVTVGLGRDFGVRPTSPLRLRGRLRSRELFHIHRAHSDQEGTLDAALEALIRPQPGGEWRAEMRGRVSLASTKLTRITSLPELDIDRGVLTTRLRLSAELDLQPTLRFGPGSAPVIDLAGGAAAVELDQVELVLGRRLLRFPDGTHLHLTVLDGSVAPAGLQGFAVDLRWDMHGRPCLLYYGERAVSLLTEELRRGQVTLLLDRSGKLSFAGATGGLYGPRYFNSLLNPTGDLDHLAQVLLSQDALNHVLGALSVFTPSAAELLSDVHALWLATRRIVKGENIRAPKDLIPRRKLARFCSLLLAGDERLVPRLTQVIKDVTEGRGLDLLEVKELLLHELSGFDIDYEVTALLNWLNLVLSPTEPLVPSPAEVEPPLVLDPVHAAALADLPSAEEIYNVVNSGGLDEAWLERLANLAPRLTRRQLGFILARTSPGAQQQALQRLRYAYEAKSRVEAMSEHYGGFEYRLQPATVASFIGEAVGPLPGINHPHQLDQQAWPPPCALGPEEIGVLLQVGLATGRQDRRTQINNRLILELLRREPRERTREVLIELGHQSPRSLSGILYAFLDQDQDQLAEPLDLAEFLSERLGVPVPRQRDFMAGGNKARLSYIEVLTRLADQIIEEAGPYLARKAHLQVMRHRPAPELILPASLETLAEQAQVAVVRSDELGARCSFDSPGAKSGPRQQARRAYGSAFRLCSRLLEFEPRAFQLPWLRSFWLRNEEALRVLSVVRGHQEDRDRDRQWLAVRTGRETFADEQDLLQTIVRVLYWQPEHQQVVLCDPLVRLLIDPPDGQYNFSIVSCMGVISDGKDGTELVDAYRRLEERRGIRVLRAHTGTARSLEYNAERIIETIEACTTPWGIIGYSQGCANALLAESMLYGGTPKQQRLLEGMVCRNFLFSAANGSAHGTAGMLKFMRALVLGERYLKHYQAIYSWEAIKSVLRLVRSVLDSRLFVAVLGGTHSLSFERARVLHRDGQFRDGVPTSITRGVISEDQLPETLEFLYYLLREQTSGAEQDTQVLVADAVGSSRRVRNAAADVLGRCDMPSFPLATHHWAPLTKEVEFVTTERDVQRAVYMSPKDRLVWPWVEVNARFGRIKMR